jgi:hypothetical protein
MLSNVIGPVKKARLNVSEAGFSAVLISQSNGRKTNPPIRRIELKKKIRKAIEEKLYLWYYKYLIWCPTTESEICAGGRVACKRSKTQEKKGSP